ncbi:MAG: PilZ domain-containing protein [Myxococcota bacterium]
MSDPHPPFPPDLEGPFPASPEDKPFSLDVPSPLLFAGPELLLEGPKPRGAIRRAVKTRCEVVAEQGFRLLATETSDVSDTGMLVPSPHGVALGEVVFISLRLPERISFIDAEAEVVRVIRGRRTTDRERSVGLRFTRLDPGDRALLVASLEGLPPPIPARKQPRDYAGSVAVFARA